MSAPSHSSSSPSHPPQTVTKPSKVLHFRNVQQPVTQQDILQLCQSVAPIDYILMLPNANQAFVQFQTQEGATQFLQEYQRYPPKVQNVTLYVQYSIHTTIEQKASPHVDGTPSRVLLVTIHNPIYAVTTEVLSQIFSKYEKPPSQQVEKIIIFQRRSGLQALIQFSNIDSATAAMRALNGKCIYKACCMLQIQYSKQTELTVVENSEHSRDYTNSGIPEKKDKALLPTSGIISSYGGMGGMGYSQYPAGVPAMMPPMQGMGLGASMPGMGMGASMPGVVGVPPAYHTVVIVNGFDPEKIGCDQLFNLFSNYGTIVRIKILHAKPNTALVQFTDYMMAASAVQYLKDVPVCGSTLSVNFSKFSSILPSKEIREQVIRSEKYTPTQSEGHASADGRTVDYEESSLNRFHRPASNSMKHLTSPTAFLYVSGLSSTVTEENLGALLGKIAKPVAIKLFEKEGRLMALVQMPSIESTVNAMCFLHNETLEGKRVRLAFTKSRL